jgi:S-adenosylmethionine:tRNA ribosyltransferase-isomerase
VFIRGSKSMTTDGVSALTLADFDYHLPADRIAHEPARPRDAARMLHVRGDGLADLTIRDLPSLLRPGDILVANDTRVFPAQLRAIRGGARIGLTLDRPLTDGGWKALARNGRRLRVGDTLTIDGGGTSASEHAGAVATEGAGGLGSEGAGGPAIEHHDALGREGAGGPGIEHHNAPGREGARVLGVETGRRGRGTAVNADTGPLAIERAATLTARITGKDPDGSVSLAFNLEGEALMQAFERAGMLALPPYIHRPDGPTTADATDYQTVFAQRQGAVAAPTAGLHFTPRLLADLKAAGVRHVTVTLHVGIGTFLPVRVEQVIDHRMHAERGEITAEAAAAINQVRQDGGRVVAVGTTSLRLLESAALPDGTLRPFMGETALFILPGYRFKAVDRLVTNFHLPRSTLLMLVSAFSGRERMLAAYAHAVAAGYRFHSYGDACFLDGLGSL